MRTVPSAPVCGLVAGAAIALVACAAQPPQPAAHAPAAEAAGGGLGAADPRRNDITVLWEEIREFRRQAGLAAEPRFTRDHPAIVESSVEDLRVCPSDPRPEDATCQDVCTLKEHICDNAEDICRIASDLGDDAWADQKCQSAKASCKEATEKCCGCAARDAAAMAP